MAFLTAEEERELIGVMRGGGVAGAEARERLTLNFVGMVKQIASKYHTDDRAVEFDDLVQAGYVGLLKGLDKFDPDKGYRVSTYVHRSIVWHVQRLVTTSGAVKRPPNPSWRPKDAYERYQDDMRRLPTMSLDAPVHESSELTLGERVAGQAGIERDVLNRLFVEDLMERARLPNKWREALWLVADGYQHREAGNAVGLAHSIPDHAVRRIREYIERSTINLEDSNG